MTPARFARCTKAAWLLLVAGTTGIGQAGAAEPEGGERARISHERSAAEARFAARDKECRERFVVSACV